MRATSATRVLLLCPIRPDSTHHTRSEGSQHEVVGKRFAIESPSLHIHRCAVVNDGWTDAPDHARHRPDALPRAAQSWLLAAGKARSGIETVARQLRSALDPLIRKNTPLAVLVKRPKAAWVEPVGNSDVEPFGFTCRYGSMIPEFYFTPELHLRDGRSIRNLDDAAGFAREQEARPGVDQRDEILHKIERAETKEEAHAAAHSFVRWLEELEVMK